jgi:hypothetical protein
MRRRLPGLLRPRHLRVLCLGPLLCLATARPALAQNPGVEFKGLTVLGVVVEELGSPAVACGLNQRTIEQAVTKVLVDGGLKTVRNSDEDTYLYVNVNTLSVPTNLCVSRYDAYLYTHATTKLSYQDRPVLVQISLLHAGGLSGGGVNGHADNVVRNLTQYVEQFVSRIRLANK